jgi:hypothetical protein
MVGPRRAPGWKIAASRTSRPVPTSPPRWRTRVTGSKPAGWRWRSTTAEYEGHALAHIGMACARSGDQATANDLLRDAIAAVRSIADTEQRFTAYQRAAPLLATVDPAVTERVVRAFCDGDGRILLLAEIAGVRATAGQIDAAATLAAEAEAGLDSIVDLAARSRAMARVAAAYAPVRRDHADRLADSVPDPDWRMEALAAVARAHDACGHSAKARAACRRAVTTARSIPLPGGRSVALAEAAKLVAEITRAGSPRPCYLKPRPWPGPCFHGAAFPRPSTLRRWRDPFTRCSMLTADAGRRRARCCKALPRTLRRMSTVPCSVFGDGTCQAFRSYARCVGSVLPQTAFGQATRPPGR